MQQQQQQQQQQPITNHVTLPMTTTMSKTTNINFQQQQLNNNFITPTRDHSPSLLSAGPNTLLNPVSNAIISSLHDDHCNNSNNHNGDKTKMLNAPVRFFEFHL